MKRLILLLPFLCACSSTTIYRDGKPLMKTQADVSKLVFRDGRTTFYAEGLNHSRPTLAGGTSAAKIIQSTGTAAGAIGAAIATGGVVK